MYGFCGYQFSYSQHSKNRFKAYFCFKKNIFLWRDKLECLSKEKLLLEQYSKRHQRRILIRRQAWKLFFCKSFNYLLSIYCKYFHLVLIKNHNVHVCLKAVNKLDLTWKQSFLILSTLAYFFEQKFSWTDSQPITPRLEMKG